MAPIYVRSHDAPDTVLMTFRVVHDARATIDGDITDSDLTGASPISRWLAWAVDYDDFVSDPDKVGYHARCQIPRGTIAIQCVTRVDTIFTAETPAKDIDIGDDNVANGWADSLDCFTAATVIMADADAVYNDPTSDPSAGATGIQYYPTGDTLDINWNHATAPAAGRALVFLKCISYHEDINEEWTVN